MINTYTTGTPGWWLKVLGTKLFANRQRADLLDAYAKGDHRLPSATASAQQAYRDFQKKSRSNYPALIVEAPRELLVVAGFRTAAVDDELGDSEAWRIWQANSLDADSGLVHGAALTMGDAYVIVGDIDDEINAPVITPEDARQVVTAHDPLRPRKVTAALKMYYDSALGGDVCYLFTKNEEGRVEIRKAFRERSNDGLNYTEFRAEGFDWYDDVQTLNSNRIPVVRFRNRPQMDGSTMGEFEDVIDIVDRINALTFDRMVIAAVQAFKQRAIKGDLPTHDPDGNVIDYNGLFEPGPDSLWMLPEGVDMWESSQADMSGILKAAQDDIRNLASVTRTPPHYLLGDFTNASADAAALARMGLEHKTQDRMKEYGESWELTMSLAFERIGDSERASRMDNEVIWTHPRRHSLSEKADAISKLKDVVPFRTLMQDVYGVSPQQLERIEAERAQALLFDPVVESSTAGE